MSKNTLRCPCCQDKISSSSIKQILLLLRDGFVQPNGNSKGEAFIHIVRRYPSLYQWACDNCLNEGKALLSNPSKFRDSWNPTTHLLAYYDKGYTCESCGEKGILGKEIQKHWYEELKLNLHVRTARCKSCRKARDLNTELSNLLKDGKPEDKASLMRVSEIYEAMGKIEKMKAYRRAAEKYS